MLFARTDRSPFGEWWWTVDRVMLAAVVAIAFAGVMLSLAAGPPMAQRLGYEAYHFVIRHFVFLTPALVVLVLTSMLPTIVIRRLSVILLLVSLIGMAATLFVGEEVKGATRWLRFGPVGIQPSEFMKPALIVTCAWFFALSTRQRRFPGQILAILIYAAAAALLVLQPDIGQTILITAAWGAMFFVAGIPFIWVAGLGAVSLGAMVVSYFTVPHVTERIDAFLNPDGNDTHQVDQALNAFRNGGLFGQGPGEGSVKRSIPDAHSDFIFSVAAEEYGIILCLIIVALFAFVVIRGLGRALAEDDQFVQLAVSGLVTLVGLQALINMGVNLQLLPAKGMTLPFISYGGSSLIAVALTFGMILALTRRRPSVSLGEEPY